MPDVLELDSRDAETAEQTEYCFFSTDLPEDNNINK